MVEKKYKYLLEIDSPEDLRKLKVTELPEVCKEIRDYILNVISVNPGHLGSSLGAIELTVAIHYVFDTPNDNIVWDVGHQTYAHKILTGRKKQFSTIRKFGGISGFPKTSESKYDDFGTGHASTSISAALGMAMAAYHQGNTKQSHIAFIGDGSIGGGMAFEAMNNAGASKANLLIILNDNGISIDKSVGGLKDYLLRMSTSKQYNNFRDRVWRMFSKNSEGPNKKFVLRQIKRNLKSSILDEGNLFEALGLRYFGPTDGHNVIELVEILSKLKNLNGPRILHCITVKGKGYSKAEDDQVRFHAPGVFDLSTGEPCSVPNANQTPKYQEVFGKTLIKLADKNDKIVGITPAMPTGSSLCLMMDKYPDRVYDVGICEEHAVTFAAGLAAKGMKPYCVIYSTFLQRAYDQIIHDVALQKLPVVFCIDRGGLVGEDGPTHHGVFDLSYLRLIPNIIISSPMDEKELQDLMYTAQFVDLPMSIRYPRDRGEFVDWEKDFEKIEIGKGRLITKGENIAILSIGPIGNEVEKAIKILNEKGINPSHYDVRFLKPLDNDLILEACTNHKNIITIEDGTIIGGLGSAILEFISDNNLKCKVTRMGIKDQFIDHGSLKELRKLCKIDKDAIVETCINLSNN